MVIQKFLPLRNCLKNKTLSISTKLAYNQPSNYTPLQMSYHFRPIYKV